VLFRSYSNPGTLTGSIGVILEFPVAEQLLKKVGVEYVVIKSGRYKDTGNFARRMTPEEREVMQRTVEDVYEQFLDEVWRGRKESLRSAVAMESGRAAADVRDGEAKARLRNLADGRVLSGRLAMTEGLVDRMGGLQSAIAGAARLVGLPDRPRTVTAPRPRRARSWTDFIGGMLGLPEPQGSYGRPSRVSLAYLLR
jgi:protease-4